ncbi:hypothetical protein C8Q74DRAFT_1285786 [Fomes fomentarius]|nr:hypothetical protein C8Q74DRAFT_1285786 [Fomes fomentarius]
MLRPRHGPLEGSPLLLCACTSSCWNLDIDLPVHTSATQGASEVRLETIMCKPPEPAQRRRSPGKGEHSPPDRACERAVLGCVCPTTNEIDTVETLRTRCPCSYQPLDGSTKRTRLEAGGCIRLFTQNTEHRTTRHTRYEIRDGDHSRYPRYTDMDPASPLTVLIRTTLQLASGFHGFVLVVPRAYFVRINTPEGLNIEWRQAQHCSCG